MPINYNDYPPNWKTEIRPRILERDGHCCKFCGVPNYAIIRIHPFKVNGMPLADIVDKPPFDYTKAIMGQDSLLRISDKEASRFSLKLFKDGLDCKIGGFKYIQIILTIAHLNDPNPMNCEDSNLAALCQKCHNKHDAPMRRVNAKATLETKKRAITGQQSLF